MDRRTYTAVVISITEARLALFVHQALAAQRIIGILPILLYAA